MRLSDEQILELRNRFVSVLKRDLMGKNSIVMMLSSGVDSRVVASLLKYSGFDNVVCVTVDSVEGVNARKIAKILGYKHRVLNKPVGQCGSTKWICLKEVLKDFDVWVFGRGFNEVFRTNKRYKAPDINGLRGRVAEYNKIIPYYAPLLDKKIIDFVESVRGDSEINHFYTCKGLIKSTYPEVVDIKTNTGFSMNMPDIGHRGIKWFCKKLGVKLR